MAEDKLTPDERLAIFKILYPDMEYDSLMESGHAHLEGILDEIGIPKSRNSVAHVISCEKPLKDQVKIVVENYKLIWK